MMDKLMSYAVTPRALQILLKSPNEPTCMPDGWFNWTHPKTSSLGGPETQRLELVSFADGARSIGIWNNKAHASGYACALLVAMDEGTHVIDIKGLRGDVVYQLVTESPVDDNFNKRLLEQLREPESILSIYWDELRRGGGGNLDEIGFQNVTAWQWWLYGKAIQHWIQQTTRGESRTAELRQVTPDFKAWNNWKHLGVPDIKLNLEKSWNSPQERIWPWSLSNPCTVSDIPTLEKDGFAAYYPLRQCPFSGIARRHDGSLETIGALPDENDANGNWVWDDGSIRRALAPQSVKNLIETLIAVGRAVVVALNPILAGNQNAMVSMADRRQLILGHKIFYLDQSLNPTVGNAALIGLSLTQMVEKNIIPYEESFELITSVLIKSKDSSTFFVGIMINGADPKNWIAALINKKFEIRENVRASDDIQYVLRRET